MSRGYVYILSNPSMPGIVKIGKTTRSVEQRCFELYHTGVPTPFEIVKAVLSPNCGELEQLMHTSLNKFRFNNSREFFLVDAVAAMSELDNALLEQVSGWLDEFIPSYSLVESRFVLCPSIPSIMAGHVGLSPDDVVEAYGYMMPDELRPAIARMQAHLSGAEKMQWLRPNYDADEALN